MRTMKKEGLSMDGMRENLAGFRLQRLEVLNWAPLTGRSGPLCSDLSESRLKSCLTSFTTCPIIHNLPDLNMETMSHMPRTVATI